MSLPSHLHALPSISSIPVSTYNHLSVEELALLPLNALPAHRAVRTLADAIVPAYFSQTPGSGQAHTGSGSTALILGGHDGPGSMAVQMLSKRGVNLCVQVPWSAVHSRLDQGDDAAAHSADSAPANGHAVVPARDRSVRKSPQSTDSLVEARLRAWGAQDVCIGNPLEVIEQLVQQGRAFDAVIDTVGGLDTWTASQKLLLAVSSTADQSRKISPQTQFTTLVGDNPAKPIPSAQDDLRSGFRSFRRAITVPLAVEGNGVDTQTSPKKSSTTSLPLTRKNSVSKARTLTVKRTVGYTWISAAADVDYEGEDVRDALGSVVGMVEEGWIRPWIGDEGNVEDRRVVPFDQSPEVFRRDGKGPVGLLQDGGTCVIRVVA